MVIACRKTYQFFYCEWRNLAKVQKVSDSQVSHDFCNRFYLISLPTNSTSRKSFDPGRKTIWWTAISEIRELSGNCQELLGNLISVMEIREKSGNLMKVWKKLGNLILFSNSFKITTVFFYIQLTNKGRIKRKCQGILLSQGNQGKIREKSGNLTKVWKKSGNLILFSNSFKIKMVFFVIWIGHKGRIWRKCQEILLSLGNQGI